MTLSNSLMGSVGHTELKVEVYHLRQVTSYAVILSIIPSLLLSPILSSPLPFLLKAGVVDELNDLAKKFMTDMDSREAIMEEAQTKAKELDNPQ